MINLTYSNITFASTRRTTKIEGKNLGRTEIVQQSDMFRKDIKWDELSKLFAELYPRNTQINCFACSDGSEAFTTVIAMKEALGADSARFLPIKASDIDADVLKTAKEGIVGMSREQVQFIKESYGEHVFNKYFKLADQEKYPPEIYELPGRKLSTSNSIRGNGYTGMRGYSFFNKGINKPARSEFIKYKVADEVLNNVDFRAADAREEAQKANDKPSIVMFRNAFYLLNNADKRSLAEDFYKNLKPGSILVTGTAEDIHSCFGIIKQAGFTKLRESKTYESLKNKGSNDKYIFIKE